MKRVTIELDRDGGCWVKLDGARHYLSSKADAYRVSANVEAMQRAGAKIEKDRLHGGKSWGYYVDGRFVGDIDKFK